MTAQVGNRWPIWILTLLCLLVLALQFQLWGGRWGIPQLHRLQDRLQLQKTENQTLEHRNRVLGAEVEDLKNGLEAIEERARSELGMIRQGEVFYRFSTESAVAPNPPAPAPQTQP